MKRLVSFIIITRSSAVCQQTPIVTLWLRMCLPTLEMFDHVGIGAALHWHDCHSRRHLPRATTSTHQSSKHQVARMASSLLSVEQFKFNGSVLNILLLLLFTTLPLAAPRANLSCNSLDGASRRKGRPCIIPYKINGQLRFECTTSSAPISPLPRHLIGRPLCPISDVDRTTLEASTLTSAWAACSSTCSLLDYKTNQQLWQDLSSLATKFPSLATTFTIGGSLEGRPLMGLTIGSQRQLRPRVRLYSGLAGDQTTGRELLGHLASHLLHSYGRDPRVTSLLDSIQVSLLPAANPDGFSRAHKGSCSGTRSREGERNGAGVSIETDFPVLEDWTRFQQDLNFDPYLGKQPETQALMAWSVDSPWMLGLHLQDGAVGVTYPLHGEQGDAGQPDGETGVQPDEEDEELKHLADVLAKGLPQSSCYYKPEGGIARGSDFQRRFRGRRGAGRGCIEDFSQHFTSSMELRLHVSCCKYPVRFAPLREWERQREGLIAFIEEANRGVKGVVFLPDNRPASGADVLVWKGLGLGAGKRLLNRNATSSNEGEYWRLLLPAPRPYLIQAVLDDCLGSGLRFASPKLQVQITDRRPRATQLIFLRHVGFCAGFPIPPRYSNLVDQFGIFHRDNNEL